MEEILAADSDSAGVASPAAPKPTRPNAIVRNLPDILGGVGGLVPGPTGAALGGVGGGLGKGIQMAITGEQPIPGAMMVGHPLTGLLPQQVMQEMAKQTGLGLVGAGAGKVVGRVGKSFYEGALRPTKNLVTRFPTIVDDMIRQRIPLGAAGVPKADKALSEAVARSGVVLDAAEQAGAQVPLAPGIKAAREAIAKVQRSGLHTHKRVKMLEKELDTIISENAANMTPNQANDFVMALQEEIEPLFVSRATGVPITGGPRLLMKMHGRIEGAMRKALRDAVPGLEKAKRSTQAAKAAVAGARHSELNQLKGTPAKIPFIPTWVRGAIPDELRGVEPVSRLGLGLSDPTLAAFLRQSPRVAAALLFNSGELPDSLKTSGRQ